MNEKLATYTLLIVDDNTTNRLILKQLLKELDLPKLEAVNGEEALAIIAALKGKPILMLLDLDMPVLDGYGVIKALATDTTNDTNIKTIVVSATFLTVSQKEMLKNTLTGYIQKPVHKDELMQHITNAIN